MSIKSLAYKIPPILLALSLGACSVYHMPIQQGNILSASMAGAIHKGMSSAQVKKKLGTPVLESPMHTNDTVYIYSLIPSKGASIGKRLIIRLRNDRVVSKHFEKDQQQAS